MTGSYHNRANKDQSNNLGHKDGGCVSAGGRSEYFLLILTAGGRTVKHHQSDSSSVSQGSFGVQKYFEVQTLNEIHFWWEILQCNTNFVRWLVSGGCFHQWRWLVRGIHLLLVPREKTCVCSHVYSDHHRFYLPKLNHTCTIPKVGGNNNFILRGSNLIWP